MAELPLYRLTEPAFLEPYMLKAGHKIEWTGEPGPHMEPLNQPARDAIEAYFKKKPHMAAGLNVVESLAQTMDETPFLNVVAEPPAPDERDRLLSIAEMASAGPQATDQRPRPDPEIVRLRDTIAAEQQVSKDAAAVIAAVKSKPDAEPPVEETIRLADEAAARELAEAQTATAALRKQEAAEAAKSLTSNAPSKPAKPSPI